MKKFIFDVELYPNYFEVGFKEFNKENIIQFEINEYKNDINNLIKFLNQPKLILIGFNSIHYDNLILNWIIQNKYLIEKESLISFLVKLKTFNDYIIDDKYDKIKQYKKKRFNSLDIDLFLYWSKMLRLSKKLSLKGLSVQLDHNLIQELPYKPDDYLIKDQMEEVRKYNINDLEITEKLCNEMEDEIKLRFNIFQNRGFKCFSWDAIKLANEELAKSYSEKIGKDIWDIKQQKFDKPTLKFKDLFKDINIEFKTDIFKNLYDNILNSVDTFKEKVLFNCKETNILLSYGQGGIHSVNKNEKYFSDSEYQIVTSDIASLYPTLISNYQLIRFPEVLNRYKEIKTLRLKAKKNKDKLNDKFFKLVLNGVSGLLDNSYMWLYYPEGAMKLRLMGQLILTKLVEEASLAGYKVFSCNTDGIELFVHKSRLQEYYKLVKEIQQQFNVVFEHEFYDRIYYWSVNDYLAVIEQPKEINIELANKNKLIKQKGSMVTKPDLGNSVDNLITPKALNNYFIYNIPIEKTIKEETNIYLFCMAPKVAKKYTVWYNNIKQQNLNRFFVSNNGAYLYKQKPEGNLENMLVGYPVQLLNKCEDINALNYNINYNFYISKARELINDIEPDQLQLF